MKRGKEASHKICSFSTCVQSHKGPKTDKVADPLWVNSLG